VIDVLAVSTDLFFASRIRSAAGAAGCSVQFVSSLEAAGAQIARLALVDLDASLDIAAVIGRLKAGGVETVVAFGPHLNTAARKAAREAGADRVLAKSKFVTELPRLLASASRQAVPPE
jgi:CheY-like chemotaxis protein